MKLFLVSFFCILLINQSISKQLASQKLIKPRADAVNVGVYYESFDADTINFISNQLKLSDILLQTVNIDLVPWGRTKYNGSAFECKSGELECHGDRIQACAVNFHSDTPKQLLQFVRCTVQHADWKSNPAKAGSFCALQVDNWLDAWVQIETCARMNDPDDVNVFLGMRDKTLKLNPTLTKVPIITINGEQNADAEKDLKTIVCNKYSGTKAAECKPVVIGLYYESYDQKTKDFINNQILKLSDGLLDKAGIDFVPWGNTNLVSGVLTCTGGQNECYADRLHACAYNFFWETPKALLQFVNCTVNDNEWKTDPFKVADECGNQIQDWIDPFSRLQPCAKLDDIDDLLIFLGMRDKTNELNPKLTSVPRITINGKNSPEAENSLQTVVCDNINGEKPGECNSGNITTTTTTSPPDNTTTPATTPAPTPGGSASAISNKLLIIAIALIAVIFSFK